MFDWWLLDVVPASYNLLPPESFYVVEGLKNKEEIRLRQTRLLNQLSSQVWDDISKNLIRKEEKTLSVIIIS